MRRRFLTFIGCHSQLQALATICDNLKTILPVTLQLMSGYDQVKEDIPKWQKICDYVVNHSDKLSEDFPEIDKKSRTGKRAPFPKQFEQYPLYITLWYQYPDPKYQARYCLLQAILLVTQHEFRQLEDKEDKHYDSTTQASTRLIRQFAEKNRPEKVQELLPLLIELPETVDSLEEYLDFILVLQEDSVDYAESLKFAIDILRRMLTYAVKQKGGYSWRYNRVWEAIQNREASRHHIITMNPEDDQGIDFSVELIQMHRQTEKEEQR